MGLWEANRRLTKKKRGRGIREGEKAWKGNKRYCKFTRRKITNSRGEELCKKRTEDRRRGKEEDEGGGGKKKRCNEINKNADKVDNKRKFRNSKRNL